MSRNTLGVLLAALALAPLAHATPTLPTVVRPTLPPSGLRKAAPAAAATRPKSEHSVTVTSIDGTTVHASEGGGVTLDADIKLSSLFMVNGVPVEPQDFPIGKPAVLRVRTRKSDGAMSVVMLCDAATAAAIDIYRKKVLIGRVLAVNDKYLLVRPNTSPDATPLTLHYTAKTIFRHGGVSGSVVAFAIDAPVAIATRALPSGLLMAVIVGDTAEDVKPVKPAVIMKKLP